MRGAYRATAPARRASTAARSWPSGWPTPGVELLVAARTDGVVPGAGAGARRHLDRAAGRRRGGAAAGRRAANRAGAARRCAARRCCSAAAGAAPSTWPRRPSWRRGSASCCSSGSLALVECNPAWSCRRVTARSPSTPTALGSCARRDRGRRRLCRRHRRARGALRGRSVLLLEARDRLGGRTWRPSLGGRPDRVRRRLGALAPAAHLVRAHPGRPGGRAQRRRGASRLVRRRRAPSARSRSATRSRGAAGTRFVDGVETALPLPARSAARARRAGPLRPADDRRAARAARARRRGARGAGRRARVAGPRAAGRGRRGLGAALARAVGLQPGAHPVHRRARDDRRRHRRAAGGDRRRGAVRACARRAGGCGGPSATAGSRSRRATATATRRGRWSWRCRSTRSARSSSRRRCQSPSGARSRSARPRAGSS